MELLYVLQLYGVFFFFGGFELSFKSMLVGMIRTPNWTLNQGT